MAKGEYVLTIGDDNVVLTRLVNKKVVNAWLGSSDPAMAQEELGEALSEDPKCPISILIDTLDQAFKEEEVPKVNILDRRKVLARNINMAFPGMNLRGAKVIGQPTKKTVLYQFASVPLDGRVPGWLDFVGSLKNEPAGIFTLATESVDLLQALTPKDAPAVEQGNHWRHLIGINVTGGLRQIIEKNGRLCLTRLTQAPPPETPPAEFADMIIRDFKATITYIRRLGYQVGDALDLVVITNAENKAVLSEMTWDGARSVNVYTPFQAGAMLDLGALGKEDHAFCDVLHAAWFANKEKAALPLTRSLAMGDTKDDLRELGFLVAPYAAALATVAVTAWTGFAGYEFYRAREEGVVLEQQAERLRASLSEEEKKLRELPLDPVRMRSAFDVENVLTQGRFDIAPVLNNIERSLQTDALVMRIAVNSNLGEVTPQAARNQRDGEREEYTAVINVRLNELITTADEALQVSRRLLDRLTQNFGTGFKVTMTAEPVGTQAEEDLRGDLAGSTEVTAAVGDSAARGENFRAEYRIAKVTK